MGGIRSWTEDRNDRPVPDRDRESACRYRTKSRDAIEPRVLVYPWIRTWRKEQQPKRVGCYRRAVAIRIRQASRTLRRSAPQNADWRSPGGGVRSGPPLHRRAGPPLTAHRFAHRAATCQSENTTLPPAALPE